MDCLVLALSALVLVQCRIRLTLILNLLRLLEQLGRWLVHCTLTHHTHWVHPGLRPLHCARVLLIDLRGVSCLLITSRLARIVPDRVQVHRLLRDVLECLLNRLLELHLLELACHHVLLLHVRKLLFHHSHSTGVLSLGRVLVAFSGLASPSVSHDHGLHHVSERIGTHS